MDRWQLWLDGAELWHTQSLINGREILQLRPKQRAYLARYGRQDMLVWKTRPIPELNEAVRLVAEFIEKESAETSAVEG